MLFTKNKHKPNKFLNYTELIEAFKLEGCPICRRIESSVRKYIESTLYENITDQPTVKNIRNAYGFCQAHSQMLIIIGDALGSAIIYKGVLLELLNDLYHENMDNFIRKKKCPVCVAAEQEIQNEVNLFYHFYEEDEFSFEFHKSNGLCIQHFLVVLNKFDNEILKGKLIKFHIEKIKSLIGNLDELIRKHDYRFSGEKIFPEESKSWLNAIKFMNGLY